MFLLPLIALVASVWWTRGAGAASFGGYSWLQFGGGSQHSGVNASETRIKTTNVASLHLLFSVQLPDVADGAPVYQASVFQRGTFPRNMLFLTTRDGHILALDAFSGDTIWSHQNGPGTCKINQGSTPCYTTSSPAIFTGQAFVYSYGLDGKVHRYALATGAETLTGGWPETVTLKPWQEKGSPALSAILAGGVRYLWAANGGYPGDNGDYQGHVTVINVATGAQKVFNTMCSNQTVHFVQSPGTPDCLDVQSAVWARASAIYDSALNKVYIGTGNGTYSPSTHYWGDSVLALKPDGSGLSGGPLDSYTPADYLSLQNSDTDLGSTAPAVLPSLSTGPVHYPAVQGGKDGLLRLINLANLSGHGVPGHTGGEVGTPLAVPQGGEVLTQPAVWRNPKDGKTWVFVANDNGITALTLTVPTSGPPSLHSQWTNPDGGTSPIVANGILYYAGGNAIRALDPTTGSSLWSDSSLGGIHWESPIVANGVVYITSEDGMLRAYSL
jgi:outer membrane protein assembly factor BamB